MRYIQQLEIERWAREICEVVDNHFDSVFEELVMCPVPRGGIPAAYAVQAAMHKVNPHRKLLIGMDPEHCDFFIDDLIDSGATRDRYMKYGKPFWVLLNKEAMDIEGEWVVFPWEGTEQGSAEDIPTRLLQYIGEDPARGGLVETPARFLKAWKHWTSGYEKKPEDILKVFSDGAQNYDEMVLVKNIPAYSKCEHHLADIFGVAHVAYIPDGKIVGLSKLNRLVDLYGRRLQVQERWTVQIADALMKHLQPKGVAVVIEARHMCMESRGVCQQGHSTTTSAMRGVFLDGSSNARTEFMGLIK